MDSVLQAYREEKKITKQNKKTKTNGLHGVRGLCPVPVFIHLEVTDRAPVCSNLLEDRRAEEGAARRSLVGSEVPREIALFTADQGRVIEEGAGCAAPLRPLVLLVCDGLHTLTARV